MKRDFFSIHTVALSGILVGLLILCKYMLGFFDGVEFVTFLVIFIGLVMPLPYIILIIPSFILAVGAIYGIGAWWIMYWFIFPTEAILSCILKRYLEKNLFFIAIWAGFWGFSIMLWYALENWILFGKAMMISSMSSAIIPNSIEGICNFVITLIAFEPLKKIVIQSLNRREQSFDQTRTVLSIIPEKINKK